MSSNQPGTFVYTPAAVRRAITGILSVRIHEHFPGYLALLEALRQTGQNELRPAGITAFHDRYLRYLDAPETKPYVSPFRSRGIRQLARLNPNVAGSYAPSSLRDTLAKVIDIVGERQEAVYSLPKDHAARASTHLLKNNKVPALSLSIFLFREYGYVLDQPDTSGTLNLFRDRFGLRADVPEEDDTFRYLFTDDGKQFTHADLVRQD